jgi:hypothetical protein
MHTAAGSLSHNVRRDCPQPSKASYLTHAFKSPLSLENKKLCRGDLECSSPILQEIARATVRCEVDPTWKHW